MFRLLAILLVLTAQALPAPVLAAWCAEPDACACCAGTCPCLEPAEESSAPLVPTPVREPEPRWQASVPPAWQALPTVASRSFASRPPQRGTDPPGRGAAGVRLQALLGVFLH